MQRIACQRLSGRTGEHTAVADIKRGAVQGTQYFAPLKLTLTEPGLGMGAQIIDGKESLPGVT